MRAWVVGGSSGDGKQQELRRGFGMLLVDVGLRILLEGKASPQGCRRSPEHGAAQPLLGMVLGCVGSGCVCRIGAKSPGGGGGEFFFLCWCPPGCCLRSQLSSPLREQISAEIMTIQGNLLR